MTGVVDMRADLKLQCLNMVVSISRLLQTLLSLDIGAKDKNVALSANKRLSEQVTCISIYSLLESSFGANEKVIGGPVSE